MCLCCQPRYQDTSYQSSGHTLVATVTRNVSGFQFPTISSLHHRLFLPTEMMGRGAAWSSINLWSWYKNKILKLRDSRVYLRKRAMTVTRAVVARMISTVWSPLLFSALVSLSSWNRAIMSVMWEMTQYYWVTKLCMQSTTISLS